MTFQRIIAGTLYRSTWATQRRSLGLLIRHNSTVSTPSYGGKSSRFSDLKDYVGEKYKGTFHVPAFSCLPELNLHQEKLRQTVYTAFNKERIDIHDWPALQDFIVAVIAKDFLRSRTGLKEVLLDLGSQGQHFAGEGDNAEDPAFMQMSPESERLILRIVRILSETLSEVPQGVFDTLFYRYYLFGLHSYSERLLDIIGGMANLTGNSRTSLLCTRLKCKKFRDYYEAFKEYQHVRDWCLERGVKDMFDRRWFRVIFNLTRVHTFDTESTPSLPVEVTAQLLNDSESYMQIYSFDILKVHSLFIDHYGKKASQAVGPKWRLYHQQIILAYHESLVDLYGEDLNGDIPILNTFFEAFHRTKLPESSMKIWNKMVNFKDKLNTAVMSGVFDFCGFEGRLSDAKKIFAWVQHSERSLELFDKNVWDSWLECLCRCGALQEAMHYTFNDMEPALRKRAEVLKDYRTSTTSKYIYHETIVQELTRRNHNEHAGNQKYSSGSTEEPQQLKRYSSKGLSTYGPDVKTFNLLLGFARSKVNYSYGFTRPELHAEIIHRLHKNYSELWPFINSVCLIPP